MNGDHTVKLDGFDGSGRMDVELTLDEIVEQLTLEERVQLTHLLVRKRVGELTGLKAQAFCESILGEPPS